MTFREVAPIITKLSLLPFFPADDDARISLAVMLADCATSADQIEWTIKRCVKLWDKWEGPHELRAVFCSKFKPADGLEAYSRLPQFGDGIPSEKEHLQLSAPAAAQLTGDIAPDATFPRDALDLMHEAMERNKTIRTAKLPSEADIEAIKRQQEAQRAGDVAVIDAEAKLAKLAAAQ